jgi:ribosome-associated protein
VLVDSGDIVAHIMQPTVRAYYNLEELWGEGKFDRPANPTGPVAAPAPPRPPAARTGATAKAAPRTRKAAPAGARAAGAARPRRRKPAA